MAGIIKFEDKVESFKKRNKTWLKGGLTALGILWCISLIFFFLTLLLNEETKLVFREVATFPLSQIYFLITNIELEGSFAHFLLFLFLNSLAYFIVGALIGLIAQKIKKNKGGR
jgi:hypothetical protein